MSYVAFDIETTGLDPQNDRVIELAVATPSRTQSWLINPGIALPIEIVNLTGITQEMMDMDGVPFSFAWEQFSRAVGRPDFLVGHNAIRFDWPFIQAECLRTFGAQPGIPIIDTAAMFKAMKIRVDQYRAHPTVSFQEWAIAVLDTRRYGLKYNLTHAAQEMGLALPEGTHRAGVDARLTLGLYEALMAQFNKESK